MYVLKIFNTFRTEKKKKSDRRIKSLKNSDRTSKKKFRT